MFNRNKSEEKTPSLKRMIYIWEENEEFYTNLPNKSDFINKMLVLARKEQEKAPIGGLKSEHPDPRMREIHRQVRGIEDKARKNR